MQPAREDVAAQDAAEDVHEDRLHRRVLQDQPQRRGDLRRVGAAADVEEVGRAPAEVREDVDGRHREAGAVDDAADVAVEVHVADADARRLALDRVGDVAPRRVGEQPLAVVGVVVEADLRVQRDDPAVRRHRERVDLEQRAVQLAKERQQLAQRLVEGLRGAGR